MLTNFCSIIIVASSVDYAGHISRLSQSQKKTFISLETAHIRTTPPVLYLQTNTYTHQETRNIEANEKLTKRINPIYFLN